MKLIDGRPRTQIVHLAARALIDTSDDVILWKMVHTRGGFETFRPIARKHFISQGGVRFTDTELAWIYFFIEQHVAKLAALAHLPADAPPPLPPETDPADGPVTIETDTVPPAYKQRVH